MIKIKGKNIPIKFNADGVATIRDGRKKIAKIIDRKKFYATKYMKKYSYDKKYPFSLEMSHGSRECSNLKEAIHMIEKYTTRASATKIKKSELNRIISVLKKVKRNDLALAMLGRGIQKLGPKQIIRKSRVFESPYDICPHCDREFPEKSGMFNVENKWYCSRCKNEIILPEYDYTQVSEDWIKLLTPEQQLVRKQRLEDKARLPKGEAFFFKVVIWNKENYNFCHPKCPYFTQTPGKPHEARCNLFGGILPKNRGKIPPFWLRMRKCSSGTDSLK